MWSRSIHLGRHVDSMVSILLFLLGFCHSFFNPLQTMSLDEDKLDEVKLTADEHKFNNAMAALDVAMLGVPEEGRSAVMFARMSAILRAHGISNDDDEDDDSGVQIKCHAKGRTCDARSALSAKARYLRDDKSIFVRVDDEANLPFWLQLTIPLKPAFASDMVLDVIDAAEVHAKSLMPDAKESFERSLGNVALSRKPALKRAASPTPLDEHMFVKLGRIETASHEMAKGMIDARGCVLVMGAYDDMESYQWYVVPIAKFNADLAPIAKRHDFKEGSMIEYLMQAPAAVEDDMGETNEGTESNVLAKLLERWAVDLGKGKGYFKQRTLHAFGAICIVTVDQFQP